MLKYTIVCYTRCHLFHPNFGYLLKVKLDHITFILCFSGFLKENNFAKLLTRKRDMKVPKENESIHELRDESFRFFFSVPHKIQQ